jgi:hypothetical protein
MAAILNHRTCLINTLLKVSKKYKSALQFRMKMAHQIMIFFYLNFMLAKR